MKMMETVCIESTITHERARNACLNRVFGGLRSVSLPISLFQPSQDAPRALIGRSRRWGDQQIRQTEQREQGAVLLASSL